MPGAGTTPGVSKTPASVNSNQRSFASTPEVLPRVLQGAHCFYWIVGLVVWNSLFTILGSHLHRFTELGVAIIAGSLTQASGIGNVVQVIVGGWAAAGFLVLGYYATEGQEWAFHVGNRSLCRGRRADGCRWRLYSLHFPRRCVVCFLPGICRTGKNVSEVYSLLR